MTKTQTRKPRVKRPPRPAIPEPAFIPPMQAKLVCELPEGPGWLYEIKWDGYRLEAIKHGDTVKLISRNAKNRKKSGQSSAFCISPIYNSKLRALCALPVPASV